MLDDDRLVERLASSGPMMAVRVRLATDAHSPSGVQWSSSPGPPAPIPSGIPCSANVVVAERRPVTLVVPALQRVFGG
jgi:HlyD family secretion protein